MHLEAQVMEHIKKFKQEKPEMNDFEERKKTLVLKENTSKSSIF